MHSDQEGQAVGNQVSLGYLYCMQQEANWVVILTSTFHFWPGRNQGARESDPVSQSPLNRASVTRGIPQAQEKQTGPLLHPQPVP